VPLLSCLSNVLLHVVAYRMTSTLTIGDVRAVEDSPHLRITCTIESMFATSPSRIKEQTQLLLMKKLR